MKIGITYISNIPLYRSYWDRTSGGEILKYYAIFSDAFIEEQQETLEKRIYDSILDNATHSNKEKDYYTLTSWHSC